MIEQDQRVSYEKSERREKLVIRTFAFLINIKQMVYIINNNGCGITEIIGPYHQARAFNIQVR